jgi:hypothetical protein
MDGKESLPPRHCCKRRPTFVAPPGLQRRFATLPLNGSIVDQFGLLTVAENKSVAPRCDAKGFSENHGGLPFVGR